MIEWTSSETQVGTARVPTYLFCVGHVSDARRFARTAFDARFSLRICSNHIQESEHHA